MNEFPLVKTVSVPMSYVSSLIGKHPYKDRWNETRNVFRRYNSEVKKPTTQDEADSPLYQDVLANHSEFFNQFINAVQIKPLQKQADEILRGLCKKHRVPFRCHRMLFTKKRGYVMESTVIKAYEREYGLRVSPVECRIVFLERGSGEFHPSNVSGEALIRLVGKADGEDSDGRILEVKCRRSGFREFYFERLQLATYVLAYKKPGVLIEFYENTLRVTNMSNEQAQELWAEAYPKLIAWRDLVEGFMVA